MRKLLSLLKSYDYPMKSGLNYTNEFTLMVAIILSAQAKDSFINTQTSELFHNYGTPEKMLELGENLFGYIKKIGLWRNKGTNILKLCKQLLQLKQIKDPLAWYDSFIGKNAFDDDLTLFGPILSKEGFPSFRLALLNLHGVGRKSANVFLNVVYKAPVFPVDTHVIRLCNRLGLSESVNPLILERTLIEEVPQEEAPNFAHYLVWHGRFVCEAKKPKCSKCKLQGHCLFFKNAYNEQG